MARCDDTMSEAEAAQVNRKQMENEISEDDKRDAREVYGVAKALLLEFAVRPEEINDGHESLREYMPAAAAIVAGRRAGGA